MLARSLDRPLRYFLAKATDGPVLIVAERIDEIAAELARRGWADQFHPSYTRMVPAHHVTTLRLVGCPDPNPVHRRFFDPPRGTLPPDLDVIGRHYIEAAVRRAARAGSRRRTPTAPIGVPFSGGIDSGAVLLCLYKLLLNEGQSPARLKAFTLSVDGEGDDARQAREFLRRTEPRDARRDDRRSVERARSAARRCRDRGLQAARRRVRGGEPRAARRHPRALSGLASARRRRRRRREPQGLSDRGEQRAHDPQRRQQPDALPGRVGRRVDQALAHLLGRLQPRLRAQLRLRARARLRGVQPVHAAVGDRGRRGDSVRRADRGLARAAVRAQGRDRRARRARGARRRDAGLPEAPVPARLGLGERRRAALSAERGALPTPLRDAARRRRRERARPPTGGSGASVRRSRASIRGTRTAR